MTTMRVKQGITHQGDAIEEIARVLIEAAEESLAESGSR